MEDVEEAQIQEQSQVPEKATSSVLTGLSVPFRVIASVALVLVGLYNAIGTVMSGVSMVSALAGILYVMVERPFFGILSFAYFLLSAVSYAVACALSFKFAYDTLRKRDIEQRLLVIFGVCLVIVIIMSCLVSPIIGTTLDSLK